MVLFIFVQSNNICFLLWVSVSYPKLLDQCQRDQSLKFDQQISSFASAPLPKHAFEQCVKLLRDYPAALKQDSSINGTKDLETRFQHHYFEQLLQAMVEIFMRAFACFILFYPGIYFFGWACGSHAHFEGAVRVGASRRSCVDWCFCEVFILVFVICTFSYSPDFSVLRLSGPAVVSASNIVGAIELCLDLDKEHLGKAIHYNSLIAYNTQLSPVVSLVTDLKSVVVCTTTGQNSIQLSSPVDNCGEGLTIIHSFLQHNPTPAPQLLSAPSFSLYSGYIRQLGQGVSAVVYETFDAQFVKEFSDPSEATHEAQSLARLQTVNSSPSSSKSPFFPISIETRSSIVNIGLTETSWSSLSLAWQIW